MNPLETVEGQAIPGEWLECTYVGRKSYGVQRHPELTVGNLYRVESVVGLMIKLEGVGLIVYPDQMKRQNQETQS